MNSWEVLVPGQARCTFSNLGNAIIQLPYAVSKADIWKKAIILTVSIQELREKALFTLQYMKGNCALRNLGSSKLIPSIKLHGHICTFMWCFSSTNLFLCQSSVCMQDKKQHFWVESSFALVSKLQLNRFYHLIVVLPVHSSYFQSYQNTCNWVFLVQSFIFFGSHSCKQKMSNQAHLSLKVVATVKSGLWDSFLKDGSLILSNIFL